MKFTATIKLTLEIPIEAESEDKAWEMAEGELSGKVEDLADYLDGAHVYRCEVDEVEAG